MIRIIIFALGLVLSGQAFAQFAPGYGPARVQAVEPPKPAAPVIATPYRGSIRILATVNGDIITTEDINNRVRAFSMSTGIPYNEQTRLLILNKVMQNTIDEKLKLQEAQRNGVEISEKEIDNSIKTFARNNNSTVAEVKARLKQAGVNEEIFREQMKTDLAWIKLIRQKTASENVTQLEIEEAIKLTKQDMSKPKYMVSEIVLDKKEGAHLDEMLYNLRRDPRFELFAAQFSESPSSSSGGQLGWIAQGQLPEALDNEIKNLAEGSISKPVLHNGQYYIFKLEKKFDPSKGELPEPSHQEIEHMLQGQKSERYAVQLMQSLRQKATIELRE